MCQNKFTIFGWFLVFGKTELFQHFLQKRMRVGQRKFKFYNNQVGFRFSGDRVNWLANSLGMRYFSVCPIISLVNSAGGKDRANIWYTRMQSSTPDNVNMPNMFVYFEWTRNNSDYKKNIHTNFRIRDPFGKKLYLRIKIHPPTSVLNSNRKILANIRVN